LPGDVLSIEGLGATLHYAKEPGCQHNECNAYGNLPRPGAERGCQPTDATQYCGKNPGKYCCEVRRWVWLFWHELTSRMLYRCRVCSGQLSALTVHWPIACTGHRARIDGHDFALLTDRLAVFAASLREWLRRPEDNRDENTDSDDCQEAKGNNQTAWEAMLHRGA